MTIPSWLDGRTRKAATMTVPTEHDSHTELLALSKLKTALSTLYLSSTYTTVVDNYVFFVRGSPFGLFDSHQIIKTDSNPPSAPVPPLTIAALAKHEYTKT